MRKNKIRILHVAQAAGGVDRYIRMLLKYLDKDKFENILVCSQDFHEEDYRGLVDSFEQVEMTRAIGGNDLKAIKEVRTLIKKYNPNIVYAHSSKAGAIARVADIGLKNRCVWLMFFLWNLLDGVDGNIARYKKQFSKMGSVYDAMSGYIAMVLSFFGWGVAAAHNPGLFQSIVQLPLDFYIVLGALSGIFVIFPRFIMHKAITTLGDQGSMKSVKDKSEYGFVKLVALNLTSIAGFVQVLMLIAVIFDIMDLFTIGYFVLNFMVMVVSLKNIFNVK